MKTTKRKKISLFLSGALLATCLSIGASMAVTNLDVNLGKEATQLRADAAEEDSEDFYYLASESTKAESERTKVKAKTVSSGVLSIDSTKYSENNKNAIFDSSISTDDYLTG